MSIHGGTSFDDICGAYCNFKYIAGTKLKYYVYLTDIVPMALFWASVTDIPSFVTFVI